MIKCLIDVSILEDSKCSKCCIYCDEKETCKYRCNYTDKCKIEDDVYNNCDECA